MTYFFRKKIFSSFLVFFCITAYATDPVNQTQSQVDAANAYQQCMNNAINGLPNCGDADDCVGMQKALANSTRADVCKFWIWHWCLWWGYEQNTQAGWAAVGGLHLQNAQSCQSLRGVSVGNARIMVGGSHETGTSSVSAANAQNTGHGSSGVSNNNFSQYDDGSKAYGLQDGEILDRVLNKGEKLGDIIANSPYGQGLKPELKEAFRQAANDPKNADLTGSNGAGGATAKNGTDEFAFGSGDGVATPSSLVSALSPANSEGLCTIAGVATKEQCLTKGGVWEPSSTDSKADRSLASASNGRRDNTRFSDNPGDKTIFQMVSAQYRKKTQTMLSFEFYLNKNKKSPVDVKAEIDRGMSL